MPRKQSRKSLSTPLQHSRSREKRMPVLMQVKRSQIPKGPRLSPADRLRYRFYEPLVLLHVLDRNGERRMLSDLSEDLSAPHLQLRDLRRTFLNQLAYICDYVKGGDTVTAMALEAQPTGVTFWVASNSQLSPGTIAFLHGILEILQNLASSRSENSKTVVEEEITQRSIEFNLKRIKAYRNLMQKPLRRCLASLNNFEGSEDKELVKRLERFQGFENDLPGLCCFSYQQRLCQYMTKLQKHAGNEPSELGQVVSRRQDFLLTRHYIGRLGSHLRAARILATAGWRMPGLFENFSIRTRPSPKPPSLPPPTDQLLTLNSIVKRMLPANSEEVQQYQEALAMMDVKFNIQDRLRNQFENKDFRPRVHAELNLLEYFHLKKVPFVDDDRYIVCSKPACYCCYHYISLHPGGFVRPSSHGIRYLNWRAPDLINATDIREKHHQRDIMNRLIAQIRLDVFRQVEQCRGPSPWRPDSTTGITSSQMHNASLEKMSSQSGDFDPILEDDEDSDGGARL